MKGIRKFVVTKKGRVKGWNDRRGRLCEKVKWEGKYKTRMEERKVERREERRKEGKRKEGRKEED